MSRPRVYLCEGENANWAIDEDRRVTALALEGVVELVARPQDAAFIHACWWEPMARLSEEAIRGKHVLCHMADDPRRVVTHPAFSSAARRVHTWIAQSAGAASRLVSIGGGVGHVPYAIDAHAWCDASLSASEAVHHATRAIAELRARSQGAYVIANFNRDTEGAALARGELRIRDFKRPDVFVEILAELAARGVPVVALLAGPRRHWVRKALGDRGVPMVFAGAISDADDFPANILPPGDVAALYRLADLALTTSHTEGGPRGVLEAAAVGCPQLSTPVGLAPDVLPPGALFTDALDAVDKIVADVRAGSLKRLAVPARALVLAEHSIEANRERWREVYGRLSANESRRSAGTGTPPVPTSTPSAPRPAPARRPRKLVCFWNEFTPPPWGGGNQFMTALMNEAKRQGYEAIANGDGADPREIAGHVINSVQFDIEKFRRLVEPGSSRVVHRIDGPIHWYRVTPESYGLDQQCFDLNATYASATVIQSWFTWSALRASAFRPVRPVLIHNAVDPGVFHARGRELAPRVSGRPLRLIASSWSDNPNKGAAVYEWLDRHLDPARVEFTFVGRIRVPLPRTRVVPAQPSEPLAELLRQHDVYITASRNDPCSNALIEAMACGLPALYYEDGGHPELTAFGGLPFRTPEQIPALLDRVGDNLGFYRNLIRVESMADICRRYMELIFSDAPYRS